jgi:hypothetical protein
MSKYGGRMYVGISSMIGISTSSSRVISATIASWLSVGRLGWEYLLVGSVSLLRERKVE